MYARSSAVGAVGQRRVAAYREQVQVDPRQALGIVQTEP